MKSPLLEFIIQINPSIIELNKWGLAYLKEMNIPCKYKEEE